MNAALVRAKNALLHYIRLAFQASGLRWDGDNEAEVEGIIDDLVEGVLLEVQKKLFSQEKVSHD